MIEFIKDEKSQMIALLTDNEFVIREVQDILDLMGDIVSNNCSRVIINEKNLHKDFFDLKTRLAGDILQKFSNYRVKLAIIGNFEKYRSKSLQDFISECNRGRSIFFVDDRDMAIRRLSGN
jgi:hypothetical protein